MASFSEPQFNSSPLLQLRNISKDEGSFFSLKYINFDMFPGEIHTLIGEHGSGKTMLEGSNFGLGLSVSYGIIKKYHGTVSGENIDSTDCQFLTQLP